MERNILPNRSSQASRSNEPVEVRSDFETAPQAQAAFPSEHAAETNVLPDPRPQGPASNKPHAVGTTTPNPLTDLVSEIQASHELVLRTNFISEPPLVAGIGFRSFKEEDSMLFHRKECKKLEKMGLYSKGKISCKFKQT